MLPDTLEMFTSHRVASCGGVDDAREALGDVFLPVDFPSAKNSARIGMSLNALSLGRLTLGYMHFHEAVVMQTAEPVNYHVDIPTNSRARMLASRGTPVEATTRTAGVFMPGRPVELACSEQFAQISLMIPRPELHSELQSLLDTSVSTPVEFESELDLTTSVGRSVLHAVRLIDDSSRQPHGPLTHPLVVRHLEQVLVHSLLFSQEHNYSAALAAPPLAAGPRSVTRAIEVMRSDPARPWTVADIAAEVCTSVRALQEGFRRSLGTSPMAYLRRYRLERVREELLTAAAGTTSVTEVAASWGFVHLGRFAAAYATRFAERPSDSLRRAR